MKNKNLTSFDDHLNAEYGKIGTPTRDRYEEGYRKFEAKVLAEMASTPAKKRGGPRPSAGRKLRNPSVGKRLKRAISLRPDLDLLIANDRSGLIEKALEQYFQTHLAVAAASPVVANAAANF